MGWKITHNSLIYAIQCNQNGKIYVGRTYRLEARIKEHFRELRNGYKGKCSRKGAEVGRNWQNDYDMFGEKSFSVYVLEKDVAPEKCKEREAYWINYYKSADPAHGYNFLTEDNSFPCLSEGKPKPYHPENYSEEAEVT